MPSKNILSPLRLAAAVAVIFSHSFLLAESSDPLQAVNQQLTIGRLGLAVFFVLSGYLVLQSWQRDPSAHRYLARRLLRLLPALLPAAVLTIAVGGLLTILPLGEYLSAPGTGLYLLNTLLLLTIDHQLPGVLIGQPYPLNQPNIPLWTLPVEMSAYLLLIPIAWVSARISTLAGSRPRMIPGAALTIALLLAIAGYGWALSAEQFAALPGQIPWLLALFFLGMSLNSFSGAALWPSGLLIITLLALSLLFTALGPLGLALLAAAAVIFATNHCWPAGQRFIERYGDLSYGLYIFAYPLQLLIAESWPQFGALAIFALALPPAALLAAASWHGIERRMLTLKPGRPASPVDGR
jgi:peptidoglycan/LPS O-acetylase OafA/YrhL